MSKLNVPENWLFCNYDADGMGRKIGRAVLSNDLDGIRHQSNLIAAGHELVKRWVKDRDGIWIMGGGDEGAFAIDPKHEDGLEELRKDYQYLVGATISIGIGESPAEAGKSLLMAKLKGKDRIMKFDKKATKEIAEIKKRAKKGIYNSIEEHKLADAYLNKGEAFGKPQPVECQWCSETDGVDPDHCKYCHGADQTEGEAKCKYCSYDNPVATTRMDMPELAEQDCEFCKEMDEQGKQECKYCNEEHSDGTANKTVAPNAMNPSPDSHTNPALAGSDKEKEQYDKMGMNPPEIGKPNPDEQPPIGQNAPMDVVPKADDQKLESPQPSGLEEPRMNIDPEDNHSKEALTGIAQEIESDGNPTASSVDAVDDTQMAGSNHAEGNVSRPEGFEQNVPGDMGLSGTNPPTDNGGEEEDPDFSGVLEEGLNRHADGIQREKVVQMASQALMQFKNSKQSLENIKMQAPDLYQASIMMLKAMIEMATLLNLGQSDQPLGQNMSQSTQLGQEQKSLMPPPQEEQNDEWHDPFPTHPDQGGQPKPGHAPSKKNPGAKEKEENPLSPQR